MIFAIFIRFRSLDLTKRSFDGLWSRFRLVHMSGVPAISPLFSLKIYLRLFHPQSEQTDSYMSIPHLKHLFHSSQLTFLNLKLKSG